MYEHQKIRRKREGRKGRNTEQGKRQPKRAMARSHRRGSRQCMLYTYLTRCENAPPPVLVFALMQWTCAPKDIMSTLHLSAYEGDANTVRGRLELGEDPNARDEVGESHVNRPTAVVDSWRRLHVVYLLSAVGVRSKGSVGQLDHCSAGSHSKVDSR